MINRRRSPSSEISRDKKLSGHRNEVIFAEMINGKVLKGTQKGDVKDQQENLYSVKSGKKWQIFLYSYTRIKSSKYLKLLQPSLEAFPIEYDTYLKDRTKCISFKETYKEENGDKAIKILTNEEVKDAIGENTYILAKEKLRTISIANTKKLNDKRILKNFYNEAIFNNDEVEYLVIRVDSENENFLVFHKDDVLETISDLTYPSYSRAGRVPIDYNVEGQKTLLCYELNGRSKNIVEIEIRNDSATHYRQVRFNMYSKDTYAILLKNIPDKKIHKNITIFGKAVETLQLY
tara:strand:- start:14933 stop:15805 length:873 start_codon:yes stop_codon:yes gene_type:complete